MPSLESPLLDLQLALYESRNPTRRWLHSSRRDRLIEILRSISAGRPRDRALEVGPGSGVYLDTLCELFSEVVASDTEQAFLARAREVGHRLPNLRPVLDDIARSTLEPCSYDLILCSEVVEHVPDSRPALAAMHRLLRPGGILVMSTPQRHSPLEVASKVAFLPGVIQLVRRIYREPILPTGHINLLTADEATTQLAESGFRILQSERRGVYLPIVAELGGAAALRLEQRLERRWQRGRLGALLWTQIYVAEA